MSRVKIELNRSGVGQLLKSQEVKSFIKDEADRRAAGLGKGYATDSKTLQTRAVSSIYTESYEAMKDNAENNSLLKAVSS